MNKIIKSSQHSLKETNIGKQNQLTQFLTEFHRMTWWFVDYFWHNSYSWTGRDNTTYSLDIKNNKLIVPSFVSLTQIPYETDLSYRAAHLAADAALGIIGSQIEKRRKQLYVLSTKMKSGETDTIKKLQSKIDSTPLIKPSKTKINLFAALDSNCCTFIQSTNTKFDGFLKLYSIGKKYGHIYLPVNFTKHSQKLYKKGYSLKTTWQISNKSISSLWEIDKPKNNGTKILGADQGQTTCLSLSDGQVTQKCTHGHDLKSINDKMARQTKGSKAFKRSQLHRTNYINWSINQLDLSDLKELKLEQLKNVRLGKKTSTSLRHWTYTEINAQIYNRCSELGVLVTEQSATYRSQRCSDCGWTHKSNRKRKEFICSKCGSSHDADINGALNHEADLYQLPSGFWRTKSNKIGFYWTKEGLFDQYGQEFTVPVV
jgi:transposase